MRLIDADALKEVIKNKYNLNDPSTLYWWTNIEKLIDNAPELGYEDGVLSVEDVTRRAIELEEAYNNGWSDGFSEGEDERPQDEITNEDIQQAIKEGFANGYEMAKAKYEKPQGKWIFHNDYHENCRYGCNQCGNLTNIPGNFCPNCGAKMRKGGAE